MLVTMPDAVAPTAPAPAEESDFAPRARRSAFKLTDKGALYLQFDRYHVLAVRPSPPRVWKKPIDGSDKWKGASHLPFELNAALREINTANAIAAGELALESLAPWQRPPTRTSARIRRDNLARFFAQLDPFVRSVVARDWGQGTWPLYCLLYSSPEAREMCTSDDGIRVAWALAQARWLPMDPWDQGGHAGHGGHAPKRPLAFARRWAKKKRRDILGRLGFPASNASVKALAKVPLPHLTLATAHALREVLNHEPSRERAQHLPELTRGVLEVLREAALRPLVDHAFLLELAAYGSHAPDDEQRVLARLRDTARLAAQLNRKLKLFSTVTDLSTRHDELVAWATKLVQATSAPFPPLPIALTPHDLQVLRPLKNGVELLEEGRQMGHCLGSLDWQQHMAHAGKLIAFSVHWPTRLTLALERGGDGTWFVHDLAGPHNAAPPHQAYRWVQDLLARFNSASTQLALQLGP